MTDDDKKTPFTVVGGRESKPQEELVWEHLAAKADHKLYHLYCEALKHELYVPQLVRDRREEHKLDHDGRAHVRLHLEATEADQLAAFAQDLERGNKHRYVDLINTQGFFQNNADGQPHTFFLDMTGSDLHDFMPLSSDVHVRAKGAQLHDFQFGGGRLSGAFDHTRLYDPIVIQGTTLHDIDSKETKIVRGQFSDVTFENVTFNEATFDACEFTHCHFKNCHFVKSQFFGTGFDQCDFQNSSMDNSHFSTHTAFQNCDMTGLKKMGTTKRDNSFMIVNCSLEPDNMLKLSLGSAIARGQKQLEAPKPRVESVDHANVEPIRQDQHIDAGAAVVSDARQLDPREPLPPGVVRFQPRGKPESEGGQS
ncbi:MAG: pentapeptide repeat-containing protein [Rickettsiales bacterium]|nr:pentapeptide repeat-containing protein [Rickettsiales bacterium]